MRNPSEYKGSPARGIDSGDKQKGPKKEVSKLCRLVGRQQCVPGSFDHYLGDSKFKAMRKRYSQFFSKSQKSSQNNKRIEEIHNQATRPV